ncbi:MAG: hypothetical protein FWF35_03900, partial [Elusimicrobia bacterium]|nr:hypothetical protein [Elusimicrobiota bacterium]
TPSDLTQPGMVWKTIKYFSALGDKTSQPMEATFLAINDGGTPGVLLCDGVAPSGNVAGTPRSINGACQCDSGEVTVNNGANCCLSTMPSFLNGYCCKVNYYWDGFQCIQCNGTTASPTDFIARKGRIWDSTTNTCQCGSEAVSVYNGTYCCHTSTPNYTWSLTGGAGGGNNARGNCCADNFFWDGTTCAQCNGAVASPTDFIARKGRFWDNTAKVCNCGPEAVPVKDGMYCCHTDTPIYTDGPGGTKGNCCPVDKPVWNGTACQVCPTDQFPAVNDGTQCCPSANMTWDGTNCVPPACASPSWIPSGDTSVCCPSTANYFYNGNCNTCVSGSTPNAASPNATGCVCGGSGTWVAASNTCTCPSGQSWNGTACVAPCPGTAAPSGLYGASQPYYWDSAQNKCTCGSDSHTATNNPNYCCSGFSYYDGNGYCCQSQYEVYTPSVSMCCYATASSSPSSTPNADGTVNGGYTNVGCPCPAGSIVVPYGVLQYCCPPGYTHMYSQALCSK